MKATILLLFSVFSYTIWSQSCTGLNFNTPGTSSTCLDFDAATAGAGSAAGCTGGGFGGGGTARIIQICTNSTAQCIHMDFTGLASANGTEISLWSGCSGGTLSGYVTGSINCYSGSSSIGWSTAGLALAANTCYYLRVWTKDPPTSSSTVCAYVESPPNDFCTAPQQIGTSPASYDNYCMTAGTAGDPAAAQFCAGTLENNAWFSFTTLSTCTFPCSVTLTISGISCTGGGNGFQIGFWTGACGSLTNIGCTSGSGGTVTATITNLNPNQTVIVGIDGNAGAYCNFSISGTNITPLPVGLVDFYGNRNNEDVQLSWQTLSEFRNDHFTIYRSVNGSDWTAVTQVGGQAKSEELTNYTFTDHYPSYDEVYYRLSQTDMDGKETILKDLVVGSMNTGSPELVVVPNPVTNGFCEMKYTSKSKSDAMLTIYDCMGNELFSNMYEVQKQENTFELDLTKLSKGIYLVRVQTKDGLSDAKFVIR